VIVNRSRARLPPLKSQRILNLLNDGLTLVELLVVIAIIAVLASLLFPALARAKVRAAISRCLNNQKQMAYAYILYTMDSDDNLPPTKGISA
jgi:prepilin-type N-terminal cleavage/methylation domain-containing protein